MITELGFDRSLRNLSFFHGKDGFAELKALPILEHKPQMPGEKKELVTLLMQLMKTIINSDEGVSAQYAEMLPRIAVVLADLVN